MSRNNVETVGVGLSGGIDSAMTAFLLQQQGFKVIGLTMSTWDDSLYQGKAIRSGCFGPGEKEDIKSAQKISEKLGIEHYIVDLKEDYQTTVLDYFRTIYLDGKTPNPCVLCNREMKFGLLPHKAKEMGIKFDYFATGHYVKVVEYEGQRLLAKGCDITKDQSYFLCRLSQSHLRNILLPLGEYSKKEIKRIAGENGFDELVARQESQDFIETEDYDFIFSEQKCEPGDIVDESGKILGKHRGIIYYTVGQRRGLNLSGLLEPFYVVGIDACRNRVTVGPKKRLYKRELIASDVIWSSGKEPEDLSGLKAKIRYQHTEQPCSIIHFESNGYRVIFSEEQLSITPGQIIAFYRDDLVLGGGFIEEYNE